MCIYTLCFLLVVPGWNEELKSQPIHPTHRPNLSMLGSLFFFQQLFFDMEVTRST